MCYRKKLCKSSWQVHSKKMPFSYLPSCFWFECIVCCSIYVPFPPEWFATWPVFSGYFVPNYTVHEHSTLSASKLHIPFALLHHLLQSYKPSSGYSLHERVRNFVLPNNNNNLSDHNFLNRILYKNIFWSIKSNSIIYGLWNGTLGTLLDKQYFVYYYCLLDK